MKYLLLAILFISLISCDNETPQFKDMQQWNNNQQHEVIIPVINPSVPIEAEQDFFQIATFGEYAEVQDYTITDVYIDDNKDMIAISFTNGEFNFNLYLNLSNNKYMLIWDIMPLANDYSDAFYPYTGVVDITEDLVKFNIDGMNINIKGQTNKDLQIKNLID